MAQKRLFVLVVQLFGGSGGGGEGEVLKRGTRRGDLGRGLGKVAQI